MAYAAILGYGTVGSGVAAALRLNMKIIEKNAGEPVTVKRVLDLRDFKGDEIEPLITHDFNDILHDGEITVVAEVMGGIEPAYTYVKALLENGKSVVTSNKELVSVHGAELMKTAADANCHFLFEASVCGGIPVIKTLSHSFSGDRITEISGILNGTTNFILTKMERDNNEFSQALEEAQRLGYAEKNPDADILGYDTCRKLAILTSLATGRQVDYTDIHTEGITGITAVDIKYAKSLDCTIKLLAVSKMDEGNVFARVAPVLIPNDHPLATVGDVYNAVYIDGNAVGDVLLHGMGAGKLPTGSAVVSDIIESVRNQGRKLPFGWSNEKQVLEDFDLSLTKKLIRVGFIDEQAARKAVGDAFGSVQTFGSCNGEKELVFITSEMTEKAINGKTDILRNSGGVTSICNQIRFY